MKRIAIASALLLTLNTVYAENQQINIPAKAVGMSVYIPPEQVTRFCFHDRSLASISMDNNKYKLLPEKDDPDHCFKISRSLWAEKDARIFIDSEKPLIFELVLFEKNSEGLPAIRLMEPPSAL